MRPHLDFILKYWVIIVFVITGVSSIAIGGQKIKTLEEAAKRQVEQVEQIHHLTSEQKVLIDRTKRLLDQMKEQKEHNKEQQDLLLKILIKLENLN